MLPAAVAPVVVPDRDSTHAEPVWTKAPPTEARQGRQNQRYGEDGTRMVAGCLPVRWNNPDDQSSDSVRVLLISSRAGKGMMFPKGGWETDESLEQAAHRETVEEAGVRGRLLGPIIGQFSFKSKKHLRSGTAIGGRCCAHMFAMEVQEELEEWPESGERTREWVTMEDASSRIKKDWMRDCLHIWIRRQGWEDVLERIATNAASVAAAAVLAPSTSDASSISMSDMGGPVSPASEATNPPTTKGAVTSDDKGAVTAASVGNGMPVVQKA